MEPLSLASSPARRSLLALAVLLALATQLLMRPAAAQDGWWDTGLRFRLPLRVDPQGTARSDRPAEVALDFSAALAVLGAGASLDPASLQVVEVDGAGGVLDATVPFQFDRASDFDAATRARGTLVFLLEGQTAAPRFYHVYFDTAGGSFTAPSFPERVSVTTEPQWAGQESFKITTRDAASQVYATYYYHKQGAGFASLIDRSGNDWIKFSPVAGTKSAGEFRGIPNAGAVFHPGYDTTYAPGDVAGNTRKARQGSTSTLVSSGPLKATIASESSNGMWAARWEIYPAYARMTITRKPPDAPYYVLYEGTPGGKLNVTGGDLRDQVVRSNGVQTKASEAWSGDIPAPEWSYIIDGPTKRIIYLVHHRDDAVNDLYFDQNDFPAPLPFDENNLMTIFGFGRDDTKSEPRLLTTLETFTFGLADGVGTSFSAASALIGAAYRDLPVAAGAPEKYVAPRPNTAPVGEADSYLVRAGRTLAAAAPGVLRNDTDAEADPLTALLVDGPSHGALTLDADGGFRYSPSPGFTGADTFTYRARDGLANSSTTTVTIAVRALVNDRYLPAIRR